jgi:hypothetical protein
MFLLVIKAIDKKNLIIMDAMDHINTNQFEIDKNKTKSHEKTFKHFKYYVKERIKRVHELNNNMVRD